MNDEAARPKDTLQSVLAGRPASLSQAHLVALGTMQKCRRRLDKELARVPERTRSEKHVKTLTQQVQLGLDKLDGEPRVALEGLRQCVPTLQRLAHDLRTRYSESEVAQDLDVLGVALETARDHLAAMLDVHG